MKKFVLLLIAFLAATGCAGILPDGVRTFFGCTGPNYVDNVQIDKDAVFDLFQDDFGTGTQYDDRFIDSGQGDVDVGDTGLSADGQVEYEPPVSTTHDPAYDKIGKMTPDELHGLQSIEIPVLVLSGNIFPFPAKQFGALVEPDECDHLHYHGASGYTLDRKNVKEPSNACGFDNAVKMMNVTGDQMIEWFHNRPRNF